MRHYKIYKSDSKELRLLKKRTRKDLIRKFKRRNLNSRRRKKGASNTKIKRQLFFNKSIENFHNKNSHKRSWYSSKTHTVFLEKSFNLRDNPRSVIYNLFKILDAAKQGGTYVKLKYKDGVSFGALYLIDMVCWEIATANNFQWKLVAEGLPKKYLEMMGQLKSIITHEERGQYAFIRNERVRVRHIDEVTKMAEINSQPYLAKVKEVREMITAAIREFKNDPNYDLSQHQCHALDGCITEQFDNIKQHVPDVETGTLCVMYDRHEKKVHILIYNFGKSIAECLQTKRLPEQVKYTINRVINNHNKKNFFLEKSFTRENALTLLAIQEGISSKLIKDKSRGHGLIDFIENIMSLHSNSQITIISGQTAIKIDKTYGIHEQFLVDRKRKVISFNNSRDIMDKPDPKHIVNMDVVFPGVLIETIVPLEA